MIRAIIVEDQPPAQRILKKYAEDLDTIEIIGVFSDALSAMNFLSTATCDLIFLDVHLPKMSGMDFLKTTDNLPAVILTTAFADYALEGYEYNVVDYLLKPFSFTRFVQAVQKVTPAHTASDEQNEVPAAAPTTSSFLIKSGYDLVKIDSAEIRYIQADSDYTIVRTSSKKLLTNHTLKYWRGKLNEEQFCQIHKSTIINIDHLTKVSGNTAYIDEHEISIGRAYKENFLRRWEA